MATSSWAKVLKTDAPAPAQQPAAPPSRTEGDGPPTTAVVDANAIINGIRFDRMASRVVTIPEVLQEVRDKQSRTFMASLPFGIETQEPTEESSKAVVNFARLTGDVHVLSAVDLKLLALAHTLEVAAHGSGHLRERPVQVKVKSKTRRSGRQLPGWGHVTNPQDWKVVDEAPDEPQGSGTGSRIAMTTFDGLPSLEAPPADAAAAAAAGTTTTSAEAVAAAAAAGAGSSSTSAGAAEAAPASTSQAGEAHDDEDGWGEDDEDDDGEWATAGKSRNAERRRRKRQAAWEARQAERARLEEAARAAAGAGAVKPAPAPAVAAVASISATTATVAAGVAGMKLGDGPAAQQEQQQQEAVDEEDEGETDDDEESDDYGEAVEVLEEGDEGEEEEEGDEGEEGEEDEEEGTVEGDSSSVAPSGTTGQAEPRDDQEFKPNVSSSVLCLTADFAMQNVLLQMGLRLVSKDGLQITRLTRWALRCHACFHVTKDASRVFCPRCGNNTLERVEVCVGPDGAEFFGVRKKYCLKGTRFSLPKPKGGRSSAGNPILSEDMLMLRMGKKLRRKERKAAAEAAAAGDADTVFLVQQAVAGGDKGTQYMLTNWKNNPNERKNVRSNRRG